MIPSQSVLTPKGCRHAVVECLAMRLMGRLLPRTSENFSSTTFVNKGKKKGRGGAGPRPSSLRGLACVWRMGFASARHLVRMSGHTAGIIDGRTGQADGKMYGTSRHNSFPGALYRT